MRSDPASTRRWLNDIRSQIELVQRFLGDLDYEAFRDDQLRFYAVTPELGAAHDNSPSSGRQGMLFVSRRLGAALISSTR